ncbi:MAG: sigma-70 family RNA polymerase sigma factor [Acidobacteriota bacterium]
MSQTTPVVEATSVLLILRFQQGDPQARDLLVERYDPRLQRFAHGFLVGRARDAHDTSDLVQEAFLRSLERLNDFDLSLGVSFQPFLFRTVKNLAKTWNCREFKRSDLPAPEQVNVTSPLERMLMNQKWKALELALGQLKESEADLIVARVFLGMSWKEVQLHAGSPSPDAARVATKRAVEKLAKNLVRDE